MGVVGGRENGGVRTARSRSIERSMYRKSGNFRVKNFHAIIFRVKIFSYASRPYENILTTKMFQ